MRAGGPGAAEGLKEGRLAQLVEAAVGVVVEPVAAELAAGAGVADAIVVDVRLARIGDQRAVVADVAEAVLVLVGLIGVGVHRAVVLRVVDAIAVRVEDRGTGVPDAVVVDVRLVRVGERRAVVTDVAVTVLIRVGLRRVGVVDAVVLRVDDPVGVRVAVDADAGAPLERGAVGVDLARQRVEAAGAVGAGDLRVTDGPAALHLHAEAEVRPGEGQLALVVAEIPAHLGADGRIVREAGVGGAGALDTDRVETAAHAVGHVHERALPVVLAASDLADARRLAVGLTHARPVVAGVVDRAGHAVVAGVGVGRRGVVVAADARDARIDRAVVCVTAVERRAAEAARDGVGVDVVGLAGLRSVARVVVPAQAVADGVDDAVVDLVARIVRAALAVAEDRRHAGRAGALNAGLGAVAVEPVVAVTVVGAARDDRADRVGRRRTAELADVTFVAGGRRSVHATGPVGELVGDTPPLVGVGLAVQRDPHAAAVRQVDGAAVAHAVLRDVDAARQLEPLLRGAEAVADGLRRVRGRTGEAADRRRAAIGADLNLAVLARAADRAERVVAGRLAAEPLPDRVELLFLSVAVVRVVGVVAAEAAEEGDKRHEIRLHGFPHEKSPRLPQ